MRAGNTPMRFKWQGVTRTGRRVSGETFGESATVIKVILRKQGINVHKIKPKRPSLLFFSEQVNAMDIALMSRQMATLLAAGIPLVQSLQLIASHHEKLALRTLMGHIEKAVNGGTSFAVALSAHPRYFNDLYCALIDAGEQSGALDTLYTRIAEHQEKSQVLHSKIKKALFYPGFVMMIAMIVTLLLLLFVIPQFNDIFSSLGATLPPFTLFVLSVSDLVMDIGGWLSLALIGLFVMFKKIYISSTAVRDRCDQLLLSIPLINTLLNKAAIARFSRTLSTTFAAGIPLNNALTLAANTCANFVYRCEINYIREDVIAGKQMHVAMQTSRIFPEMVTKMVMIGEESGNLDSMLSKVADIYEQQVDDSVDTLSSLLEPLIMVVLGVLVGGLIIAMYLPIFELGHVIG